MTVQSDNRARLPEPLSSSIGIAGRRTPGPLGFHVVVMVPWALANVKTLKMPPASQ
jgi:hypothetical protein